jgi:hypothetical protein
MAPSSALRGKNERYSCPPDNPDMRTMQVAVLLWEVLVRGCFRGSLIRNPIPEQQTESHNRKASSANPETASGFLPAEPLIVGVYHFLSPSMVAKALNLLAERGWLPCVSR